MNTRRLIRANITLLCVTTGKTYTHQRAVQHCCVKAAAVFRDKHTLLMAALTGVSLLSQFPHMDTCLVSHLGP